MKIHDEDAENADYGRVRMYQALRYQKEIGKLDGIKIPCEATVRSVMEQINLIHKPKRKPNGITKADREARKSDDLLKRDFTADAPLKKCVTDITEIKAKDGKLYVSAIFDCYDLLPVGLAMAVKVCVFLVGRAADLASQPNKQPGCVGHHGKCCSLCQKLQ